MQANHPYLQAEKSENKQAGYALLLLLFLLTLAGSFYFYQTASKSSHQKHQIQQKAQLLAEVKQRLLMHASQAPQIYATDTNKTFFKSSQVVAPGYLPCPDTNNNGSPSAPCGQGKDFVAGRLPIALNTRHFEFLNNRALAPNILYLVDSRFVTENSEFDTNGARKFAPLNPQNPGTARLQLDNQTNLVAILILTEEPSIEKFQSPSIPNKFLSNSALVATLSHQEWVENLYLILNSQKDYLCQINETATHWFNACSRVDGANSNCPHLASFNNPTGSNWREILCD